MCFPSIPKDVPETVAVLASSSPNAATAAVAVAADDDKTNQPSPAAVVPSATHRLRAAVHLLAVLLTAPLLITYVMRQYLRRPWLPRSRESEDDDNEDVREERETAFRRRTVLVTGGKMAKSLNVARALWRAGHRVVLVETHKYWCSGSRLSKAVWAFDTVADPRIGTNGGEAYLADLRRVFDAYGCDAFLPVSSPFSARYDAMFLRGAEIEGESLLLPRVETVATIGSLSTVDEDGSAAEDSTVTSEGSKGEGVILSVSAAAANFTSANETNQPLNLHFTPAMCDIMDDKHSFWEYCTNTLGLLSSDAEDGDDDGGMLPSHHLASDADVLALNKGLRDAGSRDKYVLKNLGYDPLHRLDLFCLPAPEAEVMSYLERIRADGNGISDDEPWQAQLFIEEGTEMSCFAVLRDSRLELFTCCLSSASQLRYVHAGRTTTPTGKEEDCSSAASAERNAGHTRLVDAQAAACERWADAFCVALREKDERLNGQLCWDFMCTNEEEDEDGNSAGPRAFPLECNPRVHSQCVVFGAANGDQRRFGEALVGEASSHGVLVPNMATDAEAETHFWGWWANEFYSLQETSYLLHLLEVVYALLSGVCFLLGMSCEPSARVFNYNQACDENATWYTSHFSFKDSDFDAEDPLPFLGRNLMQPLVLFWGVLVSGNEWKKYDFCIGKVVEKNGD